VRVPGDKSLSHRAVLFAALAEGESGLEGVLDSADVRSTMEAVRALGARVDLLEAGMTEAPSGLALRVRGWGASGPRVPAGPIDCGNSGTTARLLMGVLAGWPITVDLVGDESLSKRPMLRVTEPLSLMGARFATNNGRLPVSISGGSLEPLTYDSPVASAQVKTAILLAGLRASGRTLVREPAASRDHTERLLPAFGVPVGRNPAERSAWVDGPASLRATDLVVPADPSSSAFLVAAALLVPGSRVQLPGVSLNETRVGFLRVLERMRAGVRIDGWPSHGSEPVGELVVAHAPALVGTTITGDEVPSLIDEIPVLAVVATQATGTTRFEHVRELRVKESDRLAAIVEGLTALGAQARGGEDWLEVRGPTPLKSTFLDSLGDHRLGMSWFVAGLVADGPVSIDRFEAVDVSYPGFARDIGGLSSEEQG